MIKKTAFTSNGLLWESAALLGDQQTVKQGFSLDWFLLCFSSLGDYDLFHQRRAENEPSQQWNAAQQKKKKKKAAECRTLKSRWGYLFQENLSWKGPYSMFIFFFQENCVNISNRTIIFSLKFHEIIIFLWTLEGVSHFRGISLPQQWYWDAVSGLSLLLKRRQL